MPMEWKAFYHGRPVVVLGGAGFLGSHLVEHLVGLGAQVTVVDALVPGSGGRLEHLRAVASRVHLVLDSYGQTHAWIARLEEGGVIFHCAALNTHRWCNEHPYHDALWNYLPNCALAARLQRLPFPIRLLYASTRTVYAPTKALRITERHPTAPPDVYSFHAWASEQTLLRCCAYGHTIAVLRLPHLYGPRQRLTGLEVGFLGEMLRAALQGEPYELFAHGEVFRDVLYVADAVEILLRLGAHSASGVFNVPGIYVSARRIAQLLEELIGWTACRLVDTPAASFPPLSGRRLRRAIGCLPVTPLHEGLRETLRALRQQ